MTEVPCWAWQPCSVHLNSPVMKDRFVLLPLWRRWLFLIFLSWQHWLVCILFASEAAWETERMLGALWGCGSRALDFQNQLCDGLQGLTWEADARKWRKQSKTQWHTLKYVQCSVEVTWLYSAGRERERGRSRGKQDLSGGRVRNGGNSIILLSQRTTVWLRILALLLLPLNIL